MRLACIVFVAATVGLPAVAWAGAVEGTVIDARGLPVARAQVALDNARSVVTGADGTYRFADVAEGERELSVALANGALQRVWVGVAAEGDSRRDIFLLSAAAVDRAQAHIAAEALLPEASLEASWQLAEELTRENSAREARPRTVPEPSA